MLLPKRPEVEIYYPDSDDFALPGDMDSLDAHKELDARRFSRLRSDQVAMKNLLSSTNYSLAMLMRLVLLILLVLMFKGVITAEMLLKVIGLS